jgi:predicted DCC family thiol-disulfide oxidoreductase YuxK
MKRLRVIYDDGCPLCLFQVRVMTWLDWSNRTAFVPASDPRATVWASDVTREDLLRAIHCVGVEGRVWRGARCLRQVAMRIPLLLPLSLLLWIPGAMWVAERLYGWVSRHRYRLGRMLGCRWACGVLPERRRGSEADRAAPGEVE